MTFQMSKEPFLKHLNVKKVAHVIVTAEDSEFDDVILRDLSDEGFRVQYMAMGDVKPNAFAQSLHDEANKLAGVNESYAIIAYGDAASALLEAHQRATNRMCALIGYYPSTIPDPTRTHFPMDVSVLVHLAGGDIAVRRTQEIVGIQGKRRTYRKQLSSGLGVGGALKLSYPSYMYDNVEPGFAEHDLDEFDPVAHEVAWTRTLRLLREAFGIKIDIERVRDQHIENLKSGVDNAVGKMAAGANVVCSPTLVGGVDERSLQEFYRSTFVPSPEQLGARLLSRTIGTDRVVDELGLSFKHDSEIPWLLPRIPATGKKIEITVISITKVKGGIFASEHLHWDQASVLFQAGLLKPTDVHDKLKDQGVKQLAISGRESARVLRVDGSKTKDLLRSAVASSSSSKG